MNLVERNDSNMADNTQEKIKKELILKEIDQLENVVSSFSNSTTWVKKSSAPIVAAFITAAATKAVDLDTILEIFIVYIIFSWLVDSYCYYYQKKMRYIMNQKFMMLDSKWPYSKMKIEKESRLKALFNWSHILYYVFFAVALISLIIFLFLKVETCDCPCCQM